MEMTCVTFYILFTCILRLYTLQDPAFFHIMKKSPFKAHGGACLKKIVDTEKLRSYIRKYKLQDYMETDLFQISELCSFEKGEYLIHAGTPSDHLFFLVKGEAIFFSYSNGEKNTCVSYLKAATLIGEASSLWDLPPSLNVRAMTPCVCVSVSLLLHREALLSDNTFLRKVGELMSLRLRNDTRVASSLLEPMHIRLARFILEQSPDNIFSCQLTICAAVVNTSYRHLLRTIKEFCSLGILKKARRGYLVTDRDALERMIEGI